MTATRWLIAGRVHGVGFRWFTLRRAEDLNLGGWVRNLPDGRVEVVATGDDDDLRALEQALLRGPRAAHVESVEKHDYPHDQELGNRFIIK